MEVKVMEYISVREAAEKWHITLRQVQNLCKENRIPGAARFGRSWAIPPDAEKPADGRRIIADGKSPEAPDQDFNLREPLLFKTILDKLPCAVNVLAPDGTMVYANDAFMDGVRDDVRKSVIGHFNVNDESRQDAWGVGEHIRRALKGEYVFTPGVKLPNREMVGTHYRTDYAFVSIYNDITAFPVFQNGRLAFVVSMFVAVRRYACSKEIEPGKDYIDAHCLEPYSIEAAACAAGLSVSRFNKLFKQESGFTPYQYYVSKKLQKLEELLLAPGKTVEQAFSDCGMEYNSHYTALFKRHTGMTPTLYRKAHM